MKLLQGVGASRGQPTKLHPTISLHPTINNGSCIIPF